MYTFKLYTSQEGKSTKKLTNDEILSQEFRTVDEAIDFLAQEFDDLMSINGSVNKFLDDNIFVVTIKKAHTYIGVVN